MSRIVLLDLNHTLVENSHEKRSPFIAQIGLERYRQWLVDLLRDQYVILMTARPPVYGNRTLASIETKTHWQPHEAYFNAENLPPPAAKERILVNQVMPRHGRAPENYFGLESNPKTRAMYARYGIKSAPVGNDVIHNLPWVTP